MPNLRMYLGEATEHLIVSMLLQEGREVFLPVVDDHGVDILVSSDEGYQELQVKSLSKGKLFAAIHCDNPRPNYWFVFYLSDVKRMWLVNSIDFTKLASQNNQGKNIGKYSLNVLSKKMSDYEIEDFFKLP